MRINSINNVNKLYQANSTTKMNQMNKYGEKDSVQISATAKDFQAVLAEVKKSDEIRTDKVEELKKQMKEGTYDVSNKEVADKIIERFFQQL